jgi:hypothetical protein
VGDLVLRWDARNEGKWKHEKFDHLWTKPYRVSAYYRDNAYFLKGPDAECLGWGPINDRFLKCYLM